MTQSSPQTSALNPFDAAKTIAETLHGLDRAMQILAIKFASESLGLSIPPPPADSVPGTGPSPDAQPTGIPANRSTNIKQFIETKGPKTDQHFAAAVAYFFQFEAPEAQRKDTIDADTLKEAARLSGRKQVKDWRGTLNNAKRFGYFDSTAEKGQYKLNAVGENLVAMTLAGNGQAEVNRGRKRAYKKTSVKKVSAKKASVKKAAKKSAVKR